MNKQSWIYGFILAPAVLIAQDVIPESPESLANVAANRSAPFVDLLLQAEAGNKYAQYRLGNAYATGSGVPKNDAEAVKWLLQAAWNRFAEAQNSMGYRYEHGTGVYQDYGEALRWFRSAAEQNLPAAQNNLAHMYRYGKGCRSTTTER